MSSAYFIVLDKEIDFDPFVNGKSLANSAENLQQFCKSHSLKYIDEFYSQDAGAVLEDLGDFDLDDFEIPEGGNEWFSADDGINWVDSFIAKLKTEEFPQPIEPIILDLNEYKEVFLKAKLSDAKWHLELDF